MKNTELFKDLDSYIKENRIKEKSNIEELLKEGYEENIFTYGTTPYDTFLSLLDNVKIKPKRFIVVGCSIGWINFFWNEINSNIPTIGIDIFKPRIDFGNNLIEKYNLNNIKLDTTSFFDFEFKEGDIIWESNLCFNQTDVFKTNEDILGKTTKISIISYRPITYQEEYKNNINKYYFPVSWMDKQPFFIYEKL